jgi:L-serine dehydratase
MGISVAQIFKVGIGPSSSHTVGPMKAARLFAAALRDTQLMDRVASIAVELYGSLGATGRGHGTDKAVLLGLEGETPDLIDPDSIADKLRRIRESGSLAVLGIHPISFREKDALTFSRRQDMKYHSNGMRFRARDLDGTELLTQGFYSVGGGFVVSESDAGADRVLGTPVGVAFPFHSGAELLHLCRENGLRISELILENEKTWRPEAGTRALLHMIWQVMQACVLRGCEQVGVLPGPMKVRRRAAGLFSKLSSSAEASLRDPLTVLDWVNLYALAVNEENAAGGRVVTAPTNGAAGIIPAVLHYYARFCPRADDRGVQAFLLAAAAVGILYLENASISGAEVGCQGEVGVACSMAAAGLAEALGGTPEQVENAAEIGMEHNLGLTCDPIGGLVQIPCIERNAMGSVKAINAARMALRGDGKHFVSLDKVIRTMRQTGQDMKHKYKETSRGGLAVNVIEC